MAQAYLGNILPAVQNDFQQLYGIEHTIYRERIAEGNTVREKKTQDLGILQKAYHSNGKTLQSFKYLICIIF